MRVISGSAVGVVVALLMGTSAMAADLMTSEPVMSSSSVNWDGFYAGIQGGYDSDQYVALQGVVGVNFTASENFLLGIEGAMGPYIDVGGGAGNGYEGYVAARAGFVADNAMIYGLAGADIVDGSLSWIAGAGVEFAVADSTSLRLQIADYDGSFYQASAGLLWHFK